MGAHFVESRRANVFPRLSSPYSSYIWIILLTHVLTRSQGAQSQRRGWRASSECERLTLANCSESNEKFQAPERCERGACNLNRGGLDHTDGRFDHADGRFDHADG